MTTPNDSNTVQAFWVSIGSLFTFGFTLIASMILSRYFIKEDYGTYRQVLYVYSTLLTIFTLGLPRAFSYFLPRVSISEAKNLIKKITNLFFLLGGAFSVLLFVFSPQIAFFLKNPDLELALKIFSPVPLFMLPTMGLEGILSTYRKLKFLTIYKAATGLMQIVCVVLPVVLLHFNYIQAIVGFVAASFLTFILALYLKYMPVKSAGNEKTQISYNEIFRFSLPLLYASFWGIIISSTDQFFISRYFGTKIFAEFSNGSLELPFVTIIVGACAAVLFPVFSRLSYEKLDPRKEIFPLWISVFEKSAKIIYPLLLYCWFFADVLMVVLYGNIYENSSIYFRIKSIINFFTLIVYAPLIISTGKTKYYANVHLITAVILVILQYCSILIFNSPCAIAIVSLICQFGKTFALLFLVAKYFNMKVHELFPLMLLLKIVLPSIVILLGLRHILMDCVSMNKLLILFVGFIGYISLFSISSYFLQIDYWAIIKPIINRK